MPAGYSGTPLAKKLGIKESSQVALISPPKGYKTLLKPLPADVTFVTAPSKKTDLIQLFVTDREVLEGRLAELREIVRDDAAVWVSWPKKTSGVVTTVTETVIRELALPLGFVDIKVCAVDEVWSGLKLVIRKELRGK